MLDARQKKSVLRLYLISWDYNSSFPHYHDTNLIISAQQHRDRWIIGIKSYKEKSKQLNNSV